MVNFTAREHLHILMARNTKGKWKDGKKHGQGTLTYPDGEKYVGEFQDGKFNGQGTIIYPDGEQICRAVQRMGKFKAREH